MSDSTFFVIGIAIFVAHSAISCETPPPSLPKTITAPRDGGSIALPLPSATNNGQSRASNLLLTSGLITDTDLFKWREEIVNGGANKIKRRSGSVVALADDGKTELGRWNFQNAWPVRWEMSEFDSSVSAASCQVLELAVERIVKA